MLLNTTVKGPYGMIPKMIEHIHFNDNVQAKTVFQIKNIINFLMRINGCSRIK